MQMNFQTFSFSSFVSISLTLSVYLSMLQLFYGKVSLLLYIVANIKGEKTKTEKKVFH